MFGISNYNNCQIVVTFKIHPFMHNIYCSAAL